MIWYTIPKNGCSNRIDARLTPCHPPPRLSLSFQVIGLFLPETLNKPMWETLSEAIAAQEGSITMVEMDVTPPAPPPHRAAYGCSGPRSGE